MSRTEKTRLNHERTEREVEKSRARSDRLLTAIHDLERSLASAAPGREPLWGSRVNDSLSLLREAMRERIESDDGLFSDVEVAAPHLWCRVEKLRAEYASLRRRVTELMAEFDGPGEDGIADYRDIRERVGWLLTALRHQQSRENDLVFEVYNRDLGVGD